MLHISVKLLLSLADARKELDQFLTFLDLDQFLRNMLEIYTERISPNVKTILNGETIGFENPYHQKIIESGFDIFILLSILKDSQPNHPKLKLFTIDLIAKSIPKPKEKLIKFKSNQIIPLELMQVKNSNNKTTDSYKLIQQNLFENQQNIARDCSKTSISLEESSEEKKTDTSDVISKNELQMCLFFYKSLVGYVEIINNGVLRKVYFPKPFLCIYLTPNIKRSLLIEGRNDLLKRRLEHLLRNLERYKGEMLHFRMIGRLKVLNYLVKSWRLIKDLSFVLISFIILFLLIGENVSSQINQIVTIIQLILGVFVAIFCIVERYPLSMSLMPPFQREVSKYLKFREYVVKPRIKKTDFKFYICLKLHKFYQKIDNSRLKVLKIFLDFENLYNLVYLSITIVAFNNPYFYSIMLLDIIKRSKILQNIIKPVTENWIQLLKLGVLTMVIIFIFAVIAFSEYHEKFQENPNSFNMSSYGSTLWLAYMSTLNLGLRKEGGFGSVLIGYKIGIL